MNFGHQYQIYEVYVTTPYYFTSEATASDSSPVVVSSASVD